MKYFSILAVAAMALFAFTTSPADSTPGHESASITWTGTKVTGSHTGQVDFQKHNWKFDDAGTLVSASFFVDMTTITCTDLDEKTGAKLVGHLNSQDFFNTAEYPTASFKSTSVKSLGKGEYAITGDMTIKNITEEMTINATISNDGHLTTATSKVEIDRTKFDIKYGSGSFFDDLGDNMIHDQFVLDIEIKKH